MSRITIFSAPKPFENSHITVIQTNAIQSWQNLGSGVEVILIGEEAGLSETAKSLGVRHLPDVQRNSSGTPLVSSIFSLARNISDAPLMLYVNSDILLLSEFLNQAEQVAGQVKNFLMVGQRWDLDVQDAIDFSTGWENRLTTVCRTEGRLHPRGGSDYFLFPRVCYQNIPDFAIGRAGWDNWMIYAARNRGWAVVDGSQEIRVIHQNHDYSHLPAGQPHYRLPETFENIRLAGGNRTIFTLADCDHILDNRVVRRLPLTKNRLWREVEIFPLVKLHSYPMSYLTYFMIHPKKGWSEARSWIVNQLSPREDKR